MQNHNVPHALGPKEWDEIAAVDVVRDSWGLGVADAGTELAAQAYGARYDFSPMTMPGYTGDAFVLMGDSLSALVLVRDSSGRLVVS